MKADDWDRSESVPHEIVVRLIELGHLDEVRSLAGQGEWFCAREWARRLAGQGRQAEALEALAPFVASMSWEAVDTTAGLLAEWGRIDEAVALLTEAVDDHGHAAQRLAEVLEERGDIEDAIAAHRNSPDVCSGALALAELLVRHDRGDEATEVLRALANSPRMDDWVVHTLCTHYIDQGRAEEGLAYLDTLRDSSWEFFQMRLPLLVACGRRDEAITLATAHPEADSWYVAVAVADLLADAGRREEAVELLERHDAIPGTLASHLIELGRVDEAVAVLRRPRPRTAWPSPVGDPDVAPF